MLFRSAASAGTSASGVGTTSTVGKAPCRTVPIRARVTPSSVTCTVAAGFSVDFLQPGRLGQVLHADAREVSLRGRSGVYDVTVRADDPAAGDVVAEFRGRSRALGAPSGRAGRD